ncbi:MAG: xanthine dehydrogenase molybdenum-binding subunit [Phycisphaerales bacterium]|jgi:xanthine dehydrogenase YagR molybdenum-binding subunit|nr:xanthine dehydrogenase molybdenum-binding subunit [Phycisphaerales bacterium]
MPVQETTKEKQTAPAAAPEPEKKPVPKAAEPKPAPPQNDAKRTDMLPIGIAGVGIQEQEREVAAGDPPPLPINEKLSSIGKSVPRVDGRLKVTGGAKYTADVNLPGMLYGRMITAAHPHAKIKSIDISAAEKHPKVKAIHVLDRDRLAAQPEDEKAEKYPRVRYVGQPLAAIAALTREDADDAARLIKIEYELLPWVVDTTKAMQPDAPVIFQGKAAQSGSAGGGGGDKNAEQHGNVRGPTVKGDKSRLDSAFGEAAAVVEMNFKTQVQTHSALETHGVVVDFKPDQITCWSSTQGTSSVRDELAAVFEMKKSQVRVITEFMGGGFGAKFGAGNYGVLAAHLSKKAKAPVKLMLDRKQEHLCVGNRPDSHQKVKIGAKKDGTLTAIHITNYGTGGTGGGAGATGPAQNLYTCPVIVTEDSDVFTNAGPAAAFRAPGHPQGAFAFEQAIDELAHKLGLDPLAMREKIDQSEARKFERKIGAEKIGWGARKKPGADEGPIKRGIGVAQAIWYRFSSKDSHAEVRVTQDGSVEIMSGVQDIGGGIRTALAQVVAEELGLKPTDVTVKIGDTNYPAGPNSGGSVTTNSITPPARNAAWQVKQQLLQTVAGEMGVAADQLEMKDGKIIAKNDANKSMSFKQACRKIKSEQIAARVQRDGDYPTEKTPRGQGSGGLGGVQFAQVAVDTQTGVVKVEKVVAVHDCGRPINPMFVQSQINGGVIQGLSYALFENRILDRNTAIMVNSNLEQYKIAGAKEMPEIVPIVIEQYWGRSSTDAAGIGEPSTVPTAAAIANAVYNAIGVRVNQIPMTPAVILAALRQKNA